MRKGEGGMKSRLNIWKKAAMLGSVQMLAMKAQGWRKFNLEGYCKFQSTGDGVFNPASMRFQGVQRFCLGIVY